MGHRCVLSWKQQAMLTIVMPVSDKTANHIVDTYPLDGDNYPEVKIDWYSWDTNIKVTWRWVPDRAQDLPTPNCECAPKPADK